MTRVESLGAGTGSGEPRAAELRRGLAGRVLEGLVERPERAVAHLVGHLGHVAVAGVRIGQETFPVAPGDRVAQLLVQRVERAAFRAVAELGGSERGGGGFGSTGR